MRFGDVFWAPLRAVSNAKCVRGSVSVSRLGNAIWRRLRGHFWVVLNAQCVCESDSVLQLGDGESGMYFGEFQLQEAILPSSRV